MSPQESRRPLRERPAGAWRLGLLAPVAILVLSAWARAADAPEPEGYLVADVDGDRYQDVVWYASDPSNNILFHLDLADPGRGAWRSMGEVYRASMEGYDDLQAMVADVDGDHRADLILVGKERRNGAVSVRAQLSHGSGFARELVHAVELRSSLGDLLVYAGDVDKDGRADLVMKRSVFVKSGPDFEVFLATPAGGWTRSSSLSYGGSTAGKAIQAMAALRAVDRLEADGDPAALDSRIALAEVFVAPFIQVANSEALNALLDSVTSEAPAFLDMFRRLQGKADTDDADPLADGPANGDSNDVDPEDSLSDHDEEDSPRGSSLQFPGEGSPLPTIGHAWEVIHQAHLFHENGDDIAKSGPSLARQGQGGHANENASAQDPLAPKTPGERARENQSKMDQLDKEIKEAEEAKDKAEREIIDAERAAQNAKTEQERKDAEKRRQEAAKAWLDAQKKKEEAERKKKELEEKKKKEEEAAKKKKEEKKDTSEEEYGKQLMESMVRGLIRSTPKAARKYIPEWMGDFTHAVLVRMGKYPRKSKQEDPNTSNPNPEGPGRTGRWVDEAAMRDLIMRLLAKYPGDPADEFGRPADPRAAGLARRSGIVDPYTVNPVPEGNGSSGQGGQPPRPRPMPVAGELQSAGGTSSNGATRGSGFEEVDFE